MPSTRRMMSKIETQAGLHPAAPMEQRKASLQSLKATPDPEGELIAAVVPILNDVDPVLQQMAENVLVGWGARSVSFLLNTLRNLGPEEAEFKLTILRVLAQFGTTAQRAEVHIQPLLNDPILAEQAQETLVAIRQDWFSFFSLFGIMFRHLLLVVLIIGLPLLLINLRQPPANRMGWGPIISILLIGAGIWELIQFCFTARIGQKPIDLIYDEGAKKTGMMYFCLALSLMVTGVVFWFVFR